MDLLDNYQKVIYINKKYSNCKTNLPQGQQVKCDRNQLLE